MISIDVNNANQFIPEKKMTIIITMAGIGSRFKKAGYHIPKYMIVAKGKTLFQWSMDSLVDYNSYVTKYVFVVRKEDNSSNFIKQQCLNYGIKNIKIIEIDYLTDGQASTAMLAVPYCDNNDAIMIYNIDTYIEPFEMRYNDISGEGFIPCFHAKGNHWSFARLDEKGNVIEVREKDRISDNCTLGAYYFSSAKLYKELYEEYYSDNSNLEKNEKYIAPLYNLMIIKGMKVNISIVDQNKVHVLGTPEELKYFIEH